MSSEEYVKALKLIKQAKKIAIVGHEHADGDCVGSALALAAFIKSIKIPVEVYMEEGASRQFAYLEGYEIIKEIIPKNRKYDLLICVDFNTPDRMGKNEPVMQASKKILCFDHHLGFNVNCNLAISEPKYAACGEIIYEFFKTNNLEITKGISNMLYTSVSTDTGCFLYSNTTDHTHNVAAELIRLGADIEKINYINFRVFDKNLLSGLEQILRDLKFHRDGQISLTHLKNSREFDENERHKFKQYVSDIKGVRASIFIEQDEKDVFHVSLRSHGDVNVEIPARIFGGGGHKNASGFTICGNYKSIVRRILLEVEKAIDGRNR